MPWGGREPPGARPGSCRPSARDLRRDARFREQRRRETLEAVADGMYRSVRGMSDAGWTRTLYTVPATVRGLPLYDRGECMDYLVSCLRDDGFLAEEFRQTHTIYVSWDPDEARQDRLRGGGGVAGV
jgi:hypothetical protein